MKIKTTFRGETKIADSAEYLVRYYERMGYDAQRMKDDVLAHDYFQHAEHYHRNN